jgi:hypothetical protein
MENRQFGEHYALDYPDLNEHGWMRSGAPGAHNFNKGHSDGSIILPTRELRLSVGFTF